MKVSASGRSIYFAYATILALATFAFYESWSFRHATALRLADENLQSIALDIDATAKAATDHVAILREEAERALARPPDATAHPLRQSLSTLPSGTTYALRRPPPGTPRHLAVYATGAGQADALPPPHAAELDALLALAPLFDRIRLNIPQAAWIYYTSAARFVLIYPFESQAESVPWDDAMLAHPVFADTAPPRNPMRLQRWSRAYVDEAGKGLMSSTTAPVTAPDGAFRGMVALDITLNTLHGYFTGQGIEHGTTLLANEHGQLLATSASREHPGEQVPMLVDALPAEAAPLLAALGSEARGEYVAQGPWLLRAIPLQHAPWTLYHVIDRTQLGWTILADLRGGLAAVLLVVLSLLLYEQRRRSMLRLRIFKAAVDASSSAIIITDPTARIEYANPGFAQITGYSRDEVRGATPALLKSGATAADTYSELWQTISAKRPWQGELLDRRKDGSNYWADLHIAPICSARGEITHYVGVIHDISARKRADKALLDSEAYNKALFERSHVPQAILDPRTGTYVDCNDAAVAIYGYTDRADILGRTPLELSPPAQRDGRPSLEAAKARLAQCLEDGSLVFEWRYQRPDGTLWDSEVRCMVFRHRERKLIQFSLQDVTERKRQEAQVWRQANFDTLTGLANRSLLHDRLTQAMAHARRKHTRVGVIFVDLDGFKWINDTMGHDVGDELLIEVSRRLKGCVREQDTVARLGGDEFTIVVHDLAHADDLNPIGDKIVQVLRAPFHLGGIEHRMSGSAGITVYPDDGEDVKSLFRNADIAMYKSKQAGKNRYQFYAQDMQTDALARMKLEADLRVALDQKAFQLHWQPIVDTKSGELVGAEALIRWTHAERGPVSPVEFIPVAEDSGLIIGIGEWALRDAARQARAWRDMGHTRLRLAVNMSGVQFREAGLPDLVRDILNEYGIERGNLSIEITESVLMGGSETIETRMRAIKALGVGYVLDDFGTGFSSLSYLKRFPVDIVKIDRSFIHDCPQDRNDAHLVEAIINMAHSLGLRVTAEGVETQEQLDFLRGLGCDYLQGYLVSRPVSAEGLTALIERHFLIPCAEDAPPRAPTPAPPVPY